VSARAWLYGIAFALAFYGFVVLCIRAAVAVAS
jgi:hypothetical protein